MAGPCCLRILLQNRAAASPLAFVTAGSPISLGRPQEGKMQP
jgi:hypothetical protein